MKVSFQPADAKLGNSRTGEASSRVTRREKIADPRVTSVEFLEESDPEISINDVSSVSANGKRPAVYRSPNRPQMAVLTALDDGSLEDGESWRIRSDKFTIGRTSGDCVIGHDVDISGQHVEITREALDGGFSWYLTDLKSTNGTFVQVQRTFLRHGREILIGARRYVFRNPSMASGTAASVDAEGTHLGSGQSNQLADLLQPRLVELSSTGEDAVFPLVSESLTIGSDSRCECSITNDPYLSGRHARIHRDNSGRWLLSDRDSLNGVYVRVNRVAVEVERRFQVGGQRFRLRVL